MADRFTAPIAELFAVLGLDATQLDEGIANSEVSIKRFQSNVNVLADDIKRQFVQADLAVDAMSAALSQMQSQGLKASDAILKLDTSTNKYIANQERFEAQSVRMKAAYAKAQEDMAAAEEARFERYQVEDEQMSQMDYKRLQALEARTKAAVLAGETEVRAWNQIREASTAAMQSSLPFMSNYGESAGGGRGSGGGGGNGGLGFRMGAGGLNPYFRISESVGAVMGPLMDVIFPIAVITLGIDLMTKYAKSIQDVISSLTGAVDTSKQLEEATQNMLKAVETAADNMTRIDRMARQEKVSPHEIYRRIGSVDTPATRLIQAQINSLIPERNAFSQVLENLKSVPPGGRDIATRLMGQKLGITGAQDLTSESAVKRKEEIDKEIEQLTLKKVRLQEEEVQSIYKHTRAIKKWHDAIHEIPNRLPWMNPAALVSFPSYSAFGAGISAPSAKGSRPAPSLGSMMRSHTSSGSMPASQASPSSSGSSGVSIQYSYNPIFKFDGVPADIQHFMRDEAEPMLLTDFKNNTRGITEALIKTLSAAGIKVTNG